MKNTDPAPARPALAENPQGQCASDAAPAHLWQNGDLMEASDARCDMQDCAADRRPGALRQIHLVRPVDCEAALRRELNAHSFDRLVDLGIARRLDLD